MLDFPIQKNHDRASSKASESYISIRNTTAEILQSSETRSINDLVSLMNRMVESEFTDVYLAIKMNIFDPIHNPFDWEAIRQFAPNFDDPKPSFGTLVMRAITKVTSDVALQKAYWNSCWVDSEWEPGMIGPALLEKEVSFSFPKPEVVNSHILDMHWNYDAFDPNIGYENMKRGRRLEEFEYMLQDYYEKGYEETRLYRLIESMYERREGEYLFK